MTWSGVWSNASGQEASWCAGIIGPSFWQNATCPLPVSHSQTRFRSSTDVPDNIVQTQPRSALVLADCVRFWSETAGVQESPGPLLASASQPIRTGCEMDPACLLGTLQRKKSGEHRCYSCMETRLYTYRWVAGFNEDDGGVGVVGVGCQRTGAVEVLARVLLHAERGRHLQVAQDPQVGVHCRLGCCDLLTWRPGTVHTTQQIFS